MTKMTEQEARRHVTKLKRFYNDLFIYGGVNLLLILIWAMSGGGYFWPIWVIVLWGFALGWRAFRSGLIPETDKAKDYFPFLSKEWEDEQVKKYMKGEEGSKSQTPKAPPALKTEKKEPVKKGKKPRPASL